MLINKKQLVPMVFPPGAGGHFLWQLLTLHPKVMPLDKDQTMQKLFKDKTLQGQIDRVKAQITTHDQWRKVEATGYYIAPPDYSRYHTAEWTMGNDLIDVKTGDDYFYNKVNQQDFIYGMVVHRTIQFPLLHHMRRIIGFDNFHQHVQNSKGKIDNIIDQLDFSDWKLDIDCFVFQPDKFYYDWMFASDCVHELYDYLALSLSTEIVDATQELWMYYKSHH